LKAVARNRADIAGLLISPGAMAVNFYALRELLMILKIKTVEVHLAEMPDSKESYAQSVLREIALKRYLEPGLTAYKKGLQHFIKMNVKQQ